MSWNDLYFAHNPKGFNVEHINTNKNLTTQFAFFISAFSYKENLCFFSTTEILFFSFFNVYIVYFLFQF